MSSTMPTWKRALIFSSLGAGVALWFSGRRAAGAVLTGAGLGGLVLENRETLGKVVRDLPQYVEKGSQIVQTVAAIGQRLMEARRSAGRS
jgi:hypothetical protein